MENINSNIKELYPRSVVLETDGGNVEVKIGNEFKWKEDYPLFRISEIHRGEDGKLYFNFQTQQEDGSWEEQKAEGRVDEDKFKKLYLEHRVTN